MKAAVSGWRSADGKGSLLALLRIHPSTLYKLTNQGRIPGFRIGNDWRFRMELIERWMAEKSVYARLARNVIESGVN